MPTLPGGSAPGGAASSRARTICGQGATLRLGPDDGKTHGVVAGGGGCARTAPAYVHMNEVQRQRKKNGATPPTDRTAVGATPTGTCGTTWRTLSGVNALFLSFPTYILPQNCSSSFHPPGALHPHLHLQGVALPGAGLVVHHQHDLAGSETARPRGLPVPELAEKAGGGPGGAAGCG